MLLLLLELLLLLCVACYRVDRLVHSPSGWRAALLVGVAGMRRKHQGPDIPGIRAGGSGGDVGVGRVAQEHVLGQQLACGAGLDGSSEHGGSPDEHVGLGLKVSPSRARRPLRPVAAVAVAAWYLLRK